LEVATFTVDKDLYENQNLTHMWSINTFKRIQVIEKLTLSTINTLIFPKSQRFKKLTVLAFQKVNAFKSEPFKIFQK
jgi:hypothetical protein